MKKYSILAVLILCSIFLLPSCKKYLEAKSDASLSTPNTLEDLQAILDGGLLNYGIEVNNTGTDEFYLASTFWNSLPEHDLIKDAYAWNPETNAYTDWSRFYKSVLYANTVLDNMGKVTGSEDEWNNIKGSALFYRAHCFYLLAQTFAPPYSQVTANSDLGIPLRLSSDFNNESIRSSVQQTYDQLIQDIQESLPLLPVTPLNKLRPSKAAAYALLARTFLTMNDYNKAKLYADSCLQLYSTLLDYNTVSATSNAPFKRFNNEVIFHVFVEAVNGYTQGTADSTLYNSYASNDVRKAVFFRNNTDGTKRYKSSYNGDFVLFNGIATDELYLIRAECFARLNDVASAMNDLNTLLLKRFKSGTFIPYVAGNADQALTLVLQERRKELINRGLRWIDLRRLSTDPRFAVAPKRILNGQSYILSPTDLRLTWLIPIQVIKLTGLQQNTR